MHAYLCEQCILWKGKYYSLLRPGNEAMEPAANRGLGVPSRVYCSRPRSPWVGRASLPGHTGKIYKLEYHYVHRRIICVIHLIQGGGIATRV